MLPDQTLEHGGRAQGPAEADGDGRRALRAQTVVPGEPDTPVGIDAPGLGLGDVVEEDGELEDLVAREPAPERLGESPGHAARVRGEEPEVAEERVDRVDGAERVLPDGEAMGQRLGRLPHGHCLREEDVDHAPAVGDPEGGRRAREAQEAGHLVAHALGGGGHQPGRCGARLPLRSTLDREVELVGEAHEAQDADRVVGERRRSAGPEPTRREIAQASRGVQHRGRPLAEGGDPHGQRIHRHVAPGQVRLERRPAEVGEVDDGPGRAGEDDPRDAVSGANGNEGAAQTVGQPAGHVLTSPR